MNIWKNSIITQKGLALQAKLIAGTKLAITRAVAGRDYSSALDSVTNVDVVGTLTIAPVTYPEEGKCALRCLLTNEGLTEGYTATQIGVYANDPDEGEILYFIAQASDGSGTDIPSASESPGYMAEWNFYFQYGQADEVEVKVDPANTVTVGTYTEGMAKKAEKNLSNLDDGALFGKLMEETVFTTTGTGAAYEVEIPGVTELFRGLTFTMIPHVASTTTGPTLNVNGLGEKPLRQRIASTTGATTMGAIESWMSKEIPVTVTYNGTLWMVNHPRTSASYIYGEVDIEHGGHGGKTAEEARENLGITPENIGAAPSEHEHPYLKFEQVTAAMPVNETWSSVAYGNGKFVAVASGGKYAAYSVHGITWELTELPVSATWSSVAYGNGKFVAVASGGKYAAYSVDGIIWESATLPESKNWDSVAYGNGKFVAIAKGGARPATSVDGIIWESADNMPWANSWTHVAYGNGRFVTVAYDVEDTRPENDAATSADGSTWELTAMPVGTMWSSVAYGNGKFVAVASGGKYAAYSVDGITWELTELPVSATWSSVAYGNGKFVAVAYGIRKAATSVDGITWELTELPVSATWTPVAYGNGKFVTVASGGTVAYSADGEVWATTGARLTQDGVDVTDIIRAALG